MLFKFLDAVPRHEEEGDVVDLQDRKVWSGERAGLVIYTDNPVRLLLLWRRGSFGFLDLVFFHDVTWPLEFEELSRHPSPGPLCHSRGKLEA